MKTSHILHTSIILIGLCLILQKTKIKNGLAKVACILLVLSVLKRYKDDSLTINVAQRVRLENF